VSMVRVCFPAWRQGLLGHAAATGLSPYVPAHSSILTSELNKLEKFLSNSRKLFVLTGAGISTDSGIKGYRSEGVGHSETTT